MKIVLWAVCALLALMWTGGAALMAQLVAWSAEGLAAAGGVSIGAAVGGLAIPPWLGPWIDAAAWAEMQRVLVAVLGSVSAALPTVGDVAAWLVPAIWVTWGLGLVLLLGLTLAGSWLLGRLQPPAAPGAQAA